MQPKQQRSVFHNWCCLALLDQVLRPNVSMPVTREFGQMKDISVELKED
jgi:hypothetical protein